MINNFKNNKVLIFGLGLLGGGSSSAEFFAKNGAIVTVTDLKPEKELAPSLKKLKNYNIKYTLGRHEDKDFLKADLIIKNPAVPNDSPYLELAAKKKIPIETEASYFLKKYPYPENIIGVTGTRGKTTTASLISAVLSSAGFHTLLGGNVKDIGTLSILEKAHKDSKIVLELSSWQLNNFSKSPHISAITNIYEDHLNRYKDISEYINDKKKIFQFQNKFDYLIINKNCPYSLEFSQEAKSKIIYFDKVDFPLKLIGSHNRENAAAALEAAKILKIPYEIIKKTLQNFKAISGRLEVIRILNGVTYINDTTSTTPVACLKAIEAIDKPIVLIAGGNSKNLNTDLLEKEINKKVKKVILIKGNASVKFRKKIKDKVHGIIYENFSEAVLASQKISEKGDVVLLSPGFTSFGMFKNEFDRGQKFNEIVNGLK